MEAIGALERGRDAHARGAWRRAYDALSAAEAEAELAPADLERLATAGYMVGRADRYEDALERAYWAHLASGVPARAARCALWAGIHLAGRGDMERAGGLFARATRTLEGLPGPYVEEGYLLLPTMLRHTAQGELDAAYATGLRAHRLGVRFADADLATLALHQMGRVRVRQGRRAEGLGLLDEAMVSLQAGSVSPLVTGIVYCSSLAACRDAQARRRAWRWTEALSSWCERQPDMAAFVGECRVFRAEVFQHQGAWEAADREARRAIDGAGEITDPGAVAHACYRRAEVARLRGAFDEAEEAYQEAARRGWDPQPGWALLRVAQGRAGAALTALQRALAETTVRPKRVALLAAAVEAADAQGATSAARDACERLSASLGDAAGAAERGTHAVARARVALAGGEVEAALASAHEAFDAWRELDAPYEAARARELLGRARRAFGDAEGGRVELDAAARTFARLGAAPDRERVEAELTRAPRRHGLSAREHEVLQWLAAGATNKRIAARLGVSERTVDRHVSNLFHKLSVSTRAEATAYAYRHGLV